MTDLLSHNVENSLTCKTDVQIAKDILKLHFRTLVESLTLDELQEKFALGKEEHNNDLDEVDLYYEIRQEAMDLVIFTLTQIKKGELGNMSESDRFHEIQKLNNSLNEE